MDGPVPDFPQQQQLLRAVQNEQQVAYQALHRPLLHILHSRDSQWTRVGLNGNVSVCGSKERLSPGGTSSSRRLPPPRSAACGPCPPPRRAPQGAPWRPFASLNTQQKEVVTIGLEYHSRSFSGEGVKKVTFVRLVPGGLGPAPGRVLLASTLEQQVDKGLGALQGALLLRVLLLLLLFLFLLLNLCGSRATTGLSES